MSYHVSVFISRLLCTYSSSSELKIDQTGDGGIEELVENLNPGVIGYAFVRVTDPNSNLPRFVFVSWVSAIMLWCS